uniref:Uncharacterized protein n=1 Tax=Strongyloides papillosus TaxID=174720 RepID=A0A0N5BRZ2_STREA
MSKQTMEFDAISNETNTTNQRSASGSGKMLLLPTMFGINRARSSNDVRAKEFYDINGLDTDDVTNPALSSNRLSPQCSMKKFTKYSSSADVSKVGDDVIQCSDRTSGGSHGKNSPLNKSNNSVNSEK